MSIDREVFLANLHRLMKTRNITVEDLSKATFSSSDHVKHWMSGKTVPRWGNLMLIANLLDVSVHDLIMPVEEKEQEQA